MKKLLLIVLSFCIISSVYPAWFPNQINDIEIIDYYEDVETIGGWTDGGSSVYLTTSADNVGIGTSSPVAKLDVAGKFQVDSNGNIVKIDNITYDWPPDDGDAGEQLQTNGAGVLTWEAAGGGITAVGDGTTGAVFAAGDTDSLLGNLIGIGATHASSWLNIKPSGTGTAIILKIADTSAADRLVVLQTGKVGIGTTGPAYDLSLKTGLTFGIGTTQWNTADTIDGEQIGNDTIDDDSIDFVDVTGADLTLTDCGAITTTGVITGGSGVYTALTVGGQNAVTVTTAHVGDVTGPITGLTVVNDSHDHTTTTISADITRDTEWNGLDFLVGTATGSLSAEIVAGTAPSGDLGGTWASPSVTDDSHAHIYSNIDATTSANWDDQVSDETGTGGAWVFASAPTMTGDVKFSGNVGIGVSAPTQRLDIDGVIKWGNNTLPAGTGADGQLLTADGIGGVAWEAAGAADNLGNHIATQNIQLSTFYLSGDGGVEGVHVTGAGNVGVGTTGPAAKLHVNGNIISNDTLPLMRLNILNATADTLPGVALSIQKNYKITEIRAQSSGVGATNVIFSVALLTSDGTSVAHNLTTGQTATVAPLSVTSLTGGTVPSGYIVKPVIISTASTGTAPHFRFEAHGTEY